MQFVAVWHILQVLLCLTLVSFSFFTSDFTDELNFHHSFKWYLHKFLCNGRYAIGHFIFLILKRVTALVYYLHMVKLVTSAGQLFLAEKKLYVHELEFKLFSGIFMREHLPKWLFISLVEEITGTSNSSSPTDLKKLRVKWCTCRNNQLCGFIGISHLY